MTSVADWLQAQARAADPARAFDIVDISERGVRGADVETWIAGRLIEGRFSPAFVRDLTDALGWQEASDAVQAGLPHGDKLRKGFFGEIVAEESLEHLNRVITWLTH